MGERMRGRVALVTGGARGQGASIAELFIEEGASVVIGDVLEEEGRMTAKRLGERCVFVPLDVTSEHSWRSAADEGARAFGKIDALVNNAGVLHMAALEETTPDAFRRVLEVNTVGVFLGMREVGPRIADAGGGSIVNTASVNGFVGVAGTVAYGASKWAVRGMTRTIAMELGPRGVRVNTVVPGSVETAMIAPDGVEGMPRFAQDLFARLPLGRIGRASEIAHAVLFLSSDESSYCTGAEFVVDGGSLAGPVYDGGDGE